MEICLISKTVDPRTGGLGRHVLELSNSMVERGHEVTIITRQGYGYSGAGSEVVEVPFTDTGNDVLNVYSSMPGMYRELRFRIKEFDVVHGHGRNAYVYPFLRRSEAVDLPFVYTLHGVSSHHLSRKWLKPAARLLSLPEVWNVDSADRIVAVSRDTKRRAVDHYGIDPAKARVVYNGVDTDRFRPTQEFQDRVLFVGHMNSRKGPGLLLEAFSGLADDFPDTELVYVGEGRRKEEVVQAARRQGLEERVEMREDVSEEELVDLYSSSVFALPSAYEGLGMVYLEAMACGSPAVGCRSSAVPEVVEDGETGLLVDRDPESIESALRRLLSDPEMRQEMGEKGRERAKKNFSWGQIAEETLEIYREVTGPSDSSK